MTETAHHRAPVQTPEGVTHDLLGRLPLTGGGTVAVIIAAILAVAGLIRLAIMATGPAEPYTNWGYTAAVLVFLMSTAQAAPILAFATRLAKGYWGIPLRRVADLLGISGIVTTPLYLVLLSKLPDFHGRTGIWNDWPGTPQLSDGVAISLLSFTGLAIIWMTSLPDLAAVRDARGGGLARTLSLGWTGTKRQWQVQSTGIILLGAFYLMWFVWTHMYTVSDFAMSLVPGWHSSLMPPYHAVAGLQGGAAIALVTLMIVRKLAHLEAYIGVAAFWGAAKLLLGLSLLFFYFTWAEFLPPWYGRTPEEINYLGVLMFGPFLPLFALSFICNFVLPFALLIWNPIRVSARGPAFVGCIIVIGNLIDRTRIYLASWSVAGPVGAHIETWPPIRVPGIGDIAIVLGAISGVVLLFILGLRLLPPISLWEYKTALLLQVERRYGRAEVAVVAKPR